MAETTVKKLKRSHLKHYVDTTMGSATPSWYIIGKDIDDMSVDLSPSTDIKKNILDENVIQDNGFEPSLDADTYYADPSDSLYPKIKDIALNRLTGDDCKSKILEVIIDKTAGPYDAWTEDVIIKPQSYGGPQGGVNIPFKVSFDGNRTKGTVTITDKVPTFTADTTTTE